MLARVGNVPVPAAAGMRPMTVLVQDRLVAGGAGRFMTVRHLKLSGTQREIGTHLARLARAELGVRKAPWTNPFVTRVQKKFIARHWPGHFARMEGAADAFDSNLDQDELDFSFLAFDMGVPGCSCVYYPGSRTADGHSLVARNFDYTTGGYDDLPIGNSQLDAVVESSRAGPHRPYAGRPFLLELHPEIGYPTLGMCAFDLLGMMTDGINSEGLAVALLNDTETLHGSTYEPLGTNGVGLSEGQVPRFLLETCATAEEALEALLSTKQFYVAGPCHYLIGDRTGRGFVWEYSPIRNRHHVVECNDAPLPVTNHLLHVQEADRPEWTRESHRRMRILQEGIAARQRGLTRQEAWAINERAHATLGPGEGQYQSPTHPARTLWQAIYDLEENSVDIDFFLGERDGRIERSAVFRFSLPRESTVHA